MGSVQPRQKNLVFSRRVGQLVSRNPQAGQQKPVSELEFARSRCRFRNLIAGNSAVEQWWKQCEELRQALAQLNAGQRRVIALRYGADLTESDIAQVLGWPVGTVKSRLARARGDLKQALMRYLSVQHL